MLHVLGFVAIALAGGVIGYLLRGQGLKERTPKEASGAYQASQMISDSTHGRPRDNE